MQNGYDLAARHLGTPIEPQLKQAIAAGPPRLPPNDHATKLMETLWLSPDLAFKERDALFVKAPTVLQGLSLTNPPNGGFSTAARSVVVGAGPGGAEFNTRLSSTMFLQPGYPGKRMEVGPADAAQVSAEFPPYRQPDGKTRSSHGHMTIARMDQEAAANAARAAQARDELDPPLDPEPEPQPQPQPGYFSPHTAIVGATAVTAPAPVSAPGASASTAVHAMDPRRAMAVLQDLVANDGSSGSLSTSMSPSTTTTPSASTSAPLALSHASFQGRLESWWRAFLVAPMEPATWAMNDQWVPITIIVLAGVVVILLCVAVARKK